MPVGSTRMFVVRQQLPTTIDVGLWLCFRSPCTANVTSMVVQRARWRDGVYFLRGSSLHVAGLTHTCRGPRVRCCSYHKSDIYFSRWSYDLPVLYECYYSLPAKRVNSEDVCLSVGLCLPDDNFRKPWRRKFVFAHPLRLRSIRVKFVYEGHRVKVEVMGAKKVDPHSGNVKLRSVITLRAVKFACKKKQIFGDFMNFEYERNSFELLTLPIRLIAIMRKMHKMHCIFCFKTLVGYKYYAFLLYFMRRVGCGRSISVEF